MTKEEKTTATILILFPEKAGKIDGLIKMKIKSQDAGKKSFETSEISSKELKHIDSKLNRGLVSVLTRLTKSQMNYTAGVIKERYKTSKKTTDWLSFQTTALVKHHYEVLRDLRPWFGQIKWYHSATHSTDRKRIVTAPCSFSNYRPHLQFEVSRRKDTPQLKIFTEINGTVFPLDSFVQTYFFLQSRNEYFMLYYNDYLTLQRLQATEVKKYKGRIGQFITDVVIPLEKDYQVKRIDLEPQQTIAGKPVSRVFFTELNNSFLMLRPQWDYDGYVVEDPWREKEEVKSNTGLATIIRNKEQEQELKTMLESLHPNFPKQQRGFYYLSFADAQKKQWFLKTWSKLLLCNAQLLGLDMLKHFRYSEYRPKTTLQKTSEDENRISLRLEVSFGNDKIPLQELQKVLLAGQRAVMLKDSSLGILDDEWLRQHATLIKHGRVKNNELTIAASLAIALQENENQVSVASSHFDFKNWQRQWQQWLESNDELFELPTTVKASLRPYQRKGYEWMRLLASANAGGCLADDMGLGKTIQAICFICHEAEKNSKHQFLIVCPASLIYNWQQEFQKFAPHLKVAVHHGPLRNKELPQDTSFQVLITSYGTLRSDEELLSQKFWHTLFIDESHNIKNPYALTTRALANIRADISFALSGTPVVNNTFDLYAQLNMVLPGLFGSLEFFKREYADPIDRNGDEEKTLKLQKLTAPFILRRTKEQVATDLPDKTEAILWCEMDHTQMEQYETIREQIRSNVFFEIEKNGFQKAKLAVLQGIMKLRQVCNSPLLLPEEERVSKFSAKTEMLFEELEQILSHHKALVFSQFTGMLNLLAAECTERNIPYFHFDGQTKPEKRIELVNAFQQQDCNTRLFLISLKAGNAGINLTAADYVFLFDPWWNEAVQQQAIDRTHRIGQTRKVMAYKMICRNTIEEKILQLQSRKKKLSDSLITTDNGFIQNLEEEDVAFLLG